jgi:hypothetical protein
VYKRINRFEKNQPLVYTSNVPCLPTPVPSYSIGTSCGKVWEHSWLNPDMPYAAFCPRPQALLHHQKFASLVFNHSNAPVRADDGQWVIDMDQTGHWPGLLATFTTVAHRPRTVADLHWDRRQYYRPHRFGYAEGRVVRHDTRHAAVVACELRRYDLLAFMAETSFYIHLSEANAYESENRYHRKNPEQIWKERIQDAAIDWPFLDELANSPAGSIAQRHPRVGTFVLMDSPRMYPLEFVIRHCLDSKVPVWMC